ncbi:hypothetical protein PILCRDRAFT_817697 [Piloderma croceum F 1598]|uniref:Uncharacterized protein n=1 Tax=Piloderma croceum (strain F 1598) TaxID=765440 RepID=A0A0C3C5E7_PILCF|nr:hypothetical protein PILCRDRAFT_817697 [Piloderma croceum F 1598]
MSTKSIFFVCAFSLFGVVEQALGRPIFLANVNRAASSSNSTIGDFGSCTVPQIQFGTGFDNRKETSFEPVDQKSYNHGSAQNIDIITQFMCDALVNTCGADQSARNTCATAKAAADTKPAKTGAQADAFNSVFNIQTDFAAIAAVDDQGNIVTSTGPSAAPSPASSSPSTFVPSSTSTSTGSPSTTTSSGSTIGNFGSCSIPQIEFGTGFDGRKETSFQPVDETSFNHGSAQAIDIISQFICDTLTNSCGADQTAKNTCATAKTAADAQPAKTGAQADAFNAAFGIQTNFAAVAEVDDQGNVVSGNGTSSGVSNASTPTTTTATAQGSSICTSSASTASATNGANLQTFTGALGGVTAPAVTASGNSQFQVDGNSAFKTQQNAVERSCSVQHNQCADAANASDNQGDFTVAACDQQQIQCTSA